MTTNDTTTYSNMWSDNNFCANLRKGLALAEKRMLEQKAINNAPVIQCLPNGDIIEEPAAKLLEEHYGYHINIIDDIE